MLLVGRCIAGFSVGAFSIIGPIYITEARATPDSTLPRRNGKFQLLRSLISESLVLGSKNLVIEHRRIQDP